jgi:FkbM family methyltransferase
LTSSSASESPAQPHPELKISYAQNGEDVRAWRALRHIEDPFYVEVGASDPFDDSVTAALNALGWRGILVEPEPVIAESLRKARPRDVVIAAAAHSSSGVLTFEHAPVRGQGRVTAKAAVAASTERGLISVPAVRLADVLDDVAPEAVHFMSIDVEGHEADAIQGLGLEQWRPWVLCVEATEPDSRVPAWAGWDHLLLAADYHFVTFDGLNRWYVAAEHADLTDAVAEPYGVLDQALDGWHRREAVALRDDIERLEHARGDLEREVERLADEVSARLRDVERLSGQLRASEEEGRRLRREMQASQSALAEQLRRVERELAFVAHERDLASARERVMLESKSWRVTSPLRTIRWRAGLAVQTRREAASVGALPSPTELAAPPPSSPADVRRRTALRAKLEAASRRAAGR